MDRIYLSPHFDDVALSCGGLVWEQTHSGLIVGIWTICAGEPTPGDLSPFAQELHTRWGASQSAISIRKAEDMKSCHILGAAYRHLSIPDCIYRQHPQTGDYMYASETALNGPLHPGDAQVIDRLLQDLLPCLPAGATLICPLALGSHVDHQLTRLTAEKLGQKLWYYADFPYVLRNQAQVDQLKGEGWEYQVFPISESGLAAWRDSIAAHRSQISTFWQSDMEMRQAISDFLLKDGGVRLWSRSAT